MIACCGLDCSKCEAYLATRADSDDKREEVSKKWSAQYGADIKPEDINCDGCNSNGRKINYCQNLCQIRKCCTGKSLTTCAGCDTYPCDTLKKFIKMVPEAEKTLESLRS
ncbi:MAG: DUF3795 domain-containing protein [Candidatus Omnitrophica bacterium]|nr:DUF3795 domain-containing protein [Candidatus Omnitrophota bacterium]